MEALFRSTKTAVQKAKIPLDESRPFMYAIQEKSIGKAWKNMEERKKELFKFVDGGILGLLILGGFFMLVGAFAATVAKNWLGIVIFVFGAIVVAADFVGQAKLRKKVDQYEQTGELNAILLDYDKGAQYMGGHTRCGDTYILAKGSGNIIKYADIIQVYQKVTKKGFAETSRMLIAVTKDGKTSKVADLKVRNKSEEDMKQIVIEIVKRNANVKLGYK